MEPSEDGGGEPEVSDAAWDRVLAEKEHEIAQLVDQGMLVGKRKGRRLLVSAGSFYDWVGEPVPLFPDWGWEYEVFPDKQADEVERLQSARRHGREMFERAPHELVLEPPERTAARLRKGSKEVPSGGDDLAAALLTKLCEGIRLRWRELRALE